MVPELFLHKVRDSVYNIVNKKRRRLAEIYFNHLNHVKKVMFYPRTNRETQLVILRQVANHVRFYAHGQEWIDGSLERGLDWQRLEDHEFISDFFLSDQVKDLTRDQILAGLQLLDIEVMSLHCKRVDNALKAAVAMTMVPGLGFSITGESTIVPERWTIRFYVNEPDRFTFWTTADTPYRHYEGLHIIPPYHPACKGATAKWLINGSTGAFINDKLIDYLFCPTDALTDRRNELFGDWSHTNHPFKAVGRSFALQLDINQLRTKAGILQLTDVLLAALNIGENYIAVIGGFDAPLPMPENRISQLNMHSPYPGADYSRSMSAKVRGSEADCVWAYRVLEAEGQLAGAIIPAWFMKEKWLEIYNGIPLKV